VSAPPTPARSSSRHATSPTLLMALLVGIGILNSLSSDLYLPALRSLQTELGATAWQAQQTVSLFFLACAFMSLWHGAIADAFGRRRTILVALVALALSSLACLAVDRIEQLWALRALQGFAAGSGLVISRAIVLDMHRGVAAQRLLARITLVQTAAPVIAPLIGGWLTLAFGWRAVFVFLCGSTVLMGLANWRWLPETLPPARRRPLHPLTLWHAYREVLGSPSFLRLACAHVANWVTMMLYVVSAPVFVMQLLGRDESGFYLVYGPMMLGIVAGSLLFPALAVRLRQKAVLAAAYAVLGLATVLNLALSWQLPPGLHNVIPIFVYAAGLALAMPILVARALDPFGDRSGVASSCHTFLQFAVTGVIAGALAPLLWGSVWALAVGATVLTAVGAAILWWEWRSIAVSKSPAVA
jgi:DHA1 family bicyclomycin/chloramphenicol resistance-like MFS transporter